MSIFNGSSRKKKKENKYLNFNNDIRFAKRIVFPISVPGHPQDVKVRPLNSTAVHVQWKPPAEKNRNGVIRGYHIHVQETKEDVIHIY